MQNVALLSLLHSRLFIDVGMSLLHAPGEVMKAEVVDCLSWKTARIALSAKALSTKAIRDM